MNPHQAYRRTAQSAWTRIEMLLTIYDRMIESLDTGLLIIRENRTQDFPAAQLRSVELCLLLISGIDPDSSETSARIHNLCVFCMGQLKAMDTKAWEDVRTIMNTLREGFQGIREEGIRLEAEGVISPLEYSAEQTLLHV